MICLSRGLAFSARERGSPGDVLGGWRRCCTTREERGDERHFDGAPPPLGPSRGVQGDTWAGESKCPCWFGNKMAWQRASRNFVYFLGKIHTMPDVSTTWTAWRQRVPRPVSLRDLVLFFPNGPHPRKFFANVLERGVSGYTGTDGLVWEMGRWWRVGR